MSESKNVGIGTISATDSDETSRNVGMGSVAVVGGTGGGVTPEELEQGLATKQDVLTAGPGIDLSSNTVSANISTLTTDQIIAIKEALGVDETVLWEGDVSSGSVTLSESASNFSRLKVYGRTNDKWAVYTEVYTDVTMFSLIGMWGSSTRVQFKTTALQNNDTSISFTQSSVIKFTSVANEVTPEYNVNQVYVTKIIGVGRKTGGN